MNVEEFRQHILKLFFQDMHQIQHDNYSFDRFSYDGIDRSMIFDASKHAMYLEWFLTHCGELFLLLSRLDDLASRDLYINLLRYKLSGHLHVRIEAGAAHMEQEVAEFKSLFAGAESAIQHSGMFGNLRHYDIEWNSVHYTIDTTRNGLLWPLVYQQYFFSRGSVRIQPQAGDYLLDCGACLGDTTAVFAKRVGPTGRVFAFDPVKNHIEICKLNCSRPGLENVRLFASGVSDRSVLASPIALDAYSPGFRSVGSGVPLVRIDDLVIDGEIERIDFIKMDIEGAEVAALRGASASIHKFRPKLAISIYHRPNDFFEIGNLIFDMGLGYKMYVDHHTTWEEETVLYASCD